MAVQYVKANVADYDEVIDLANYVFSAAHVPHDFPVLLPKLYKRDHFMEGFHYLAREGGRIKAVIGAYPLVMNILGDLLPGRSIGMVSVHPYARSRGYMRALMEMALEDMRQDGVVFSCLGGQRQRYEYFGYVPAGTRLVFECRKANIRHTLGQDFTPGFSLRELGPADGKLLEKIRLFHESKIARVERKKERFFDILSSWKSRVYALVEGETFGGYLVYHPGADAITEINLEDFSRLPEAVGLCLNSPDKTGRSDRVSVVAQSHEREKLAVLSRFAEDYTITTAYSFHIFNYPRILTALLNLKSRGETLADGEAVLRIGREKGLRIAVSGGKAGIFPADNPAEIHLSHREAVEFFFSPLAPLVLPAVRKDPFLRSLLPLPLFFENADGV
jgi:predicted N-acetyltransferase YhbS